jgi:predicted kinase
MVYMMDKYIKRFFDAPADSFFIFGPRGTGKSTWLQKTFPDAYLIDLLDDSTFKTILLSRSESNKPSQPTRK